MSKIIDDTTTLSVTQLRGSHRLGDGTAVFCPDDDAQTYSAGDFVKIGPNGGLVSGDPAFSDLTGSISPSQTASGTVSVTSGPYTVLDSSRGKLTVFNSGSSVSVGLPQAGSGGNFTNGWWGYFENRGSGTVTITGITSTIDGGASIALSTNQGAIIFSDGTNYYTFRGMGGGGGSSPARTTANLTTASLAAGATDTGTIALAKTFCLIGLTVDRPARVRLYSTASARTADASRSPGTLPAAGSQHEVIADVLLTVSTGLSWIMSPSAIGSNMDGSPSNNIYYSVQNNDTITHTVAVTFNYIPLES